MNTNEAVTDAQAKVFDYTQAANYLNCKRSLVENLKLRGELPFVLVGNRFIRFRKQDLDNFINNSVVTTIDEAMVTNVEEAK